MRPVNLTPRVIAFLLAVWLTTAVPIRAAEESTPSTKAAAPREAGAQAKPAANPAGAAPPAPTPSADQPPERPPSKPQPMKTFRPSEEIHVDKAVDFPADI